MDEIQGGPGKILGFWSIVNEVENTQKKEKRFPNQI